MNETATEKGTSKNAKITITNIKGRLSKLEIERLVNRLKNSKIKTKKSEKEFRLVTLWKDTALTSSTHLKTAIFKESLLL